MKSESRGSTSPSAFGARPRAADVAPSYARLNRAARESRTQRGRHKPSPDWTAEEYQGRWTISPDPEHLEHYQEGGDDE